MIQMIFEHCSDKIINFQLYIYYYIYIYNGYIQNKNNWARLGNGSFSLQNNTITYIVNQTQTPTPSTGAQYAAAPQADGGPSHGARAPAVLFPPAPPPPALL